VEIAIAHLRALIIIALERLKKPTENLRKYSLCPGHDSNRVSLG
jgi:hypothetical protein